MIWNYSTNYWECGIIIVLNSFKQGAIMIIKNKLESIDKINKLGLNKFPEQLFKNNNEENVKRFLQKYPADYYAIRDKSRAGGIFKLKVDYDKVLDEIKDYNLFTINVSSANYVDNQLLVGEIEFLSNGEVYAILSVDPTASVRDALSNPSYNLKTDIFDKKLNNIPHFDLIYQYIVEHDLRDIIVEFALFDKEVGIKKEKVIVYELRTHY